MPTSLFNKELEVMRRAVSKIETTTATLKIQSPEVKKIIKIVEKFLHTKRLVCYGGTAINNILPEKDQFYDKKVEIPDYDFFSPNAMEDAIELADIYAKEGYTEVEAKAGVHHGTYKVFVNYIPVADITYLVDELFQSVSKDAISVNGIRYAPPDYLRMAMYLELSRPAGDVSRWEKVLKRLALLNKAYPLRNPKCELINFQRDFEDMSWEKTHVYYDARDILIEQGVVFFGGYASTLYGQYMPPAQRKKLEKTPDFDVLSENPDECARRVKEGLCEVLFAPKEVEIIEHDPVGEIIPRHLEIRLLKKVPVCFIYEPIACHSYNTITVEKKKINVATIDTILTFYLAFTYVNRPYYDNDRLLCMAQYLFSIQAKNRVKQKGVLKRFSMNCYGNQLTLQDMRETKAKKYKELRGQRNTREYKEHFLRYIPQNKRNKTAKKRRRRKKRSRRYKP